MKTRVDQLLDRRIEVMQIIGEIGGLEVSGLAYHSGKVSAGDLFVAIKGYVTDGHRYARAAVDAGAACVVAERPVEGISVPQIIVRDSRAALALMSAAYYDYPARKLLMIGITATNGKTTTSFMLYDILRAAGRCAGLIGTVLVRTGTTEAASYLTTPESLDLQRYLAEMVENGFDACVMEVSSSALELSRVAGIEYDIAAFNNLSREHIDLHGSFENYFAHKSTLITGLGERASAVLSADVPEIAALSGRTAARCALFTAASARADVELSMLDLSTGKPHMQLTVRTDALRPARRGEVLDIRLGVAGYHSAVNAMSAATIALVCGVEPERIVAGLSGFAGVERRFQMIYDREYQIIDDHFANAGNIEVTFETLRRMKYRNLHLVYAIRGGRGPTVNRENAESIARWAPVLGIRRVIASRSRSQVDWKDVVTEEEEGVFLEVMEKAGIAVTMCDELSEASEAVLGAAAPGDVILMAGCQGMDFGAKAILGLLAEKLGDPSVLAPLATRVAGV